MVSIYKFTNLLNGKIYVGSTSNIVRRQREHKCHSQYSKHTYAFYNSIKKYGWESFMFDVIEVCCPLLRNDRENHWINYYHTLDKRYGYNLISADNHICTEETRQKRSTSRKGKKASLETRRKISEAGKGRKLSDKTRENIRQGKLKQYKENGCKLTGRKHSDERKKKSSESKKGNKNPNFGKYGELNPNYGNRGEKNPLYGKKHTEEHNQRSSEAKLGDKNPNFGKKLSAERIENLREGHRKYWEQYRKNKQKQKQLQEDKENDK